MSEPAAAMARQGAEQALQGLHRSMDALAQQMRGRVAKPLPWALVPAVGVLVTLWLVGVAQIFSWSAKMGPGVTWIVLTQFLSR